MPRMRRVKPLNWRVFASRKPLDSGPFLHFVSHFYPRWILDKFYGALHFAVSRRSRCPQLERSAESFSLVSITARALCSSSGSISRGTGRCVSYSCRYRRGRQPRLRLPHRWQPISLRDDVLLRRCRPPSRHLARRRLSSRRLSDLAAIHRVPGLLFSFSTLFSLAPPESLLLLIGQ
jgi:hypothetical protein